ncbi:MAG: hypothetical protein NC093_11150 [Alistipes sp.]|nr:hypothetical protein [Alistipes sp.]
MKKMIVEATAEMLNERNDIRSVKINDLDIPFQPDITVVAETVNEDLSEKSEINMTM